MRFVKSEKISNSKSIEKNRLLLRLWLYGVLLFLFALIIVGGATRLTDSGLSITEWQPIHGVIPPLSAAEWEEEFAKYRQIPEYQQINEGMSLEEFKVIFWWEWVHRFLARAVGLIFLVPLLVFWFTRRLENQIKPMLFAILALGGLQAAIGWWMVVSGLSVRVDVSQYRLAMHFTLACLIFTMVMIVARDIVFPKEEGAQKITHYGSAIMVGMIFLQLYLGALVAGLDAGLSYNNWPLMDGAIIPHGLFIQTPFWINLFENPKTVQFMHRIMAYVLILASFAHMVTTLRAEKILLHIKNACLLFLLITVQAIIGVLTLLYQVPVAFGIIHQGLAVITLGFAIIHWRAARSKQPHALPKA